MSKTVIALFEDAGRAQSAVEALRANGFVDERIELQSGEEFLKYGEVPPLEREKPEGLYRGVKAFLDEIGLTSPAAPRPGEYHPIQPEDAVVLVETADDRADTAAAVLDREGAINVEERIERSAIPPTRRRLASGLEAEGAGKTPSTYGQDSGAAERTQTYSTADTTRPRNPGARIYGPANEPYDDEWAPRGPKPH